MYYKFFLFFLIPLSLSAQSLDNWVIGSGGASSLANSTKLEWTLGEPLVSSVITPHGIITEGFHQPMIEVRIIYEQRTEPKSDIQVYPNPTSSQLFVNLIQIPEQQHYFWLFDMSGRIVDTGDLGTGKTHSIDMHKLVSGTYLLKISQSDVLGQQPVNHHFQIIKN